MSAGPTSLDNVNAMAYAITRILKEKCEDKNSEFNGRVKWVTSKDKIFSCPSGLENCDYGHCEITDVNLCNELSQPFFDSSGKPIPENELKKNNAGVPLEFHQDKGCVYSDFILKRWCEVPASRGFKVDDKGNVTATSKEPGVTDVPPFRYSESDSKCYMTKAYCDAMETDFKDGPIPTCKEPTDAKILGYFGIGQTFFKYIKRFFEGKVDCDKVSKIVDDKVVKNKKLISKDFGGEGINLYLLEWKPDMITTIPPNVGFLYSELKNNPDYKTNLIKDKDGYYYFRMTLNELQNLEQEMKAKNRVNYHKRIYATYTHNQDMILMISEAIKNF